MKSFRFLHAADLHLDSPLKGLAAQQGSAVESIRNATREAAERLVSTAIEERVDFLIIAGDLYDGDWRDYNTGLFFAAQMGRLREAGISVYLIQGNHDAESAITRHLSLPDNVHVFSTRRAQTCRVEGLDVALHGQGFRQKELTENIALSYPEPVPGTFNIGVLHTGLGGLGGHANYAPCSLEDLVNRGYDYWALGHVHQGQVLHEHPHVVFPGNLQGRHIRETGPKGARLVSVEDGQVVDLTMVPCDVVRWSVCTVAVDGADTLGAVRDLVRRQIEKVVDGEAEGRLLACRVRLEGRCHIHADIVAGEAALLAQAQADALALGDGVAWVEKLVVASEAPFDAEALARREDAIGELQQMLRHAAGDPDLVKQIESDIGEMIRKLPAELRSDIDDDILAAAVEGDCKSLVERVAPYLSARLLAGDG